ncbi:Regulatory CAT8 [Fusarium agapanthi]|uniref:Regulatory CAT8 n=1 Tax=Fusarium agapanthi TaxID=1803897 RepID=A0A9P5BAP0_9HYPO|nr:Regulatory CAT8 [Fusarium agapanthi]
MNYPPLLPRGPTSLSNEAIPAPAPKRRAVAVACDSCRSRKVRCTGEFPTCIACQRRGGECHYADIANDREMHANQLKRRVKELEVENRSFRRLFESLRKPGGATDQKILRRLQAGDDFGAVIEHARVLGDQGKRKRSPAPNLMARQRPSEWTTIRSILPRTPMACPAAVCPIVLPIHASPFPPPLPLPPIDIPSSPRDAILGLLTLSREGKPDLVLLNESRPKEHCDLRLNELSVSYWTRVPISNRSASTLISTFLETDNSAVGFIDRDLFLTDLVQHNPTFCSAFLVSSILYLACFAHTASDGRAATLAHSFFNDAERLYRADRLSDSLTTLAAINIFSLGCFSHGNDNLGQDLLLSGCQMGKRMNLYGLDPTSSEELLVFEKFAQRGRLQFVKSITLRVTGSFYSYLHEGCDCDILQRIFPDIISSTTAIESIHIEKWWNGFGICRSHVFSTRFKLPPSVKQLSYFHGVSQGYIMNPISANLESLDLGSQAADHLEHIALSYTITASDFFDGCKEVEFKQLKTLALTHRFFGTLDNQLLKAASEADKRMPALEMM